MVEKRLKIKEESLYIRTAPQEHVEMYLKAIMLLNEAGESPVRIVSLAKKLNVAPPSVVQMLSKLEGQGLISYIKGTGVFLTEMGESIAKRIIRNSRLLEVLMEKHLGIVADERVICGVEHHMSEEFSEALCRFLEHPRRCPHGLSIPAGNCCRAK